MYNENKRCTKYKKNHDDQPSREPFENNKNRSLDFWRATIFSMQPKFSMSSSTNILQRLLLKIKYQFRTWFFKPMSFVITWNGCFHDVALVLRCASIYQNHKNNDRYLEKLFSWKFCNTLTKASIVKFIFEI